MPEALSIAPSKKASWWAMTRMSSSVVPGSVPQTLASRRPERISVVSSMCIFARPASISD